MCMKCSRVLLSEDNKYHVVRLLRTYYNSAEKNLLEIGRTTIVFQEAKTDQYSHSMMVFFLSSYRWLILNLFLFLVIDRFLPARRYASAVFATATCPSVCPSVRLSVTRRYCA